MYFRLIPIVVSFMTGCLLAQPVVFKLQIPELGDRVIDADVVEVPGAMPKSLILRVLNPVAADVDYGKIQAKLNGEGAGYIMAVSSAEDGKVARLDLNLREGMKLVPGTNTVEIQALNKRGRKYYRNFLIKTREEARNEYFSYEAKRGVGTSEPPPEISIVQPQQPILVSEKEISKKVLIKGTISALNPLAEIRIGSARLKTEKPVFAFDQVVEVGRTDKYVMIEAIDNAGSRTSVTVPVNRAGAVVPPKLIGDRYAVIIGISDYAVGKPGLPRLSATALDARNFATSLIEKAGFKRENVLLLTDEAATHAQVQNALQNFTSRAGPDDLLLVFYAAYGLHDPLDPSKIYIAAHDTQLGQVPQTAVSIEDLHRTLRSNIKSRQSLLLFDVNHTLTGDWAIRNNNLINNYLLKLFPGDPSKAVMVASSTGESSVEPGTGGGLFARHLIEAAQGRADTDRDGIITVREWFVHVSRAVKTESGGAQNPRFTLQEAERPVFARVK
jgi:hypothetical protein